ncbi:TolC family outer membrane protein [Vibrio tapetis subsp. quintayensis]|uniref:TolC family outer membrane protein n=1 Tax=Vibrio tapetis TaxID=52443 RepID=UPI0025B491EB|nr:TolC family outer membrane protein [Vibrio tapetis]MDN3681112.1 TolC family outer membrane protein [Vibrio tapetis subsp. quintayensis]
MKFTSLSVLFCGALISLTTNAQTLEQAVSITLATNPEIKSAFNEYMSSKHTIDISSGAYKPDINLDAGVGYEHINPADSTSRESTNLTRKDASLTLSQLIWDGSKTLNDINRTSADAESVRYQLLTTAQNTSLEVTQIYLEILKSTEVLALSESNLSTHKKIYKDIKKRTESGIGSTADLTQVKARLAKANSNVLAAQNNLRDAETMYIRLVGQHPISLVFPKVDQNFVPTDLKQALILAHESHPVIKIAQADVESANFQYQQSKGNNFPAISFEAAQNWRDDAGGIEGSSNELSAMLRLRYNLYNGGSDSATIDKNAYQINKAKDLRERAFRNVDEGLKLAWSALDLTSQQKIFLSQHVDAASDTVIAYEKQYRIGKRTLLDLLNTENELFESRKGYVEAHYAQQYAKYRILTSTGTLLDALRVDIPKQWNQKVEY